MTDLFFILVQLNMCSVFLLIVIHKTEHNKISGPLAQAFLIMQFTTQRRLSGLPLGKL
jgi:hypothetical protein